MADIAKSLLFKIIEEADLLSAIKAGVRVDWFEDRFQREVFKWMMEYLERYEETPTFDALHRQFPNFRRIETDEPYDYYLDEFKEMRRRGFLVDAVTAANEAIDHGDHSEAERLMEQGLERARTAGTSEIMSVLASEIQPRKVRWLWPGRIPKGKITVVEGHAGEGKTTLMLYVIACLSCGRALHGAPRRVRRALKRKPMMCLIMTAEDDPADTLIPRLVAAGADLSRVKIIKGRRTPDGETLLSLPDNIDMLRSEIEATGAGFLMIDPFNAFLTGKIDSYKDADIRRALAPLSKLAEETGVALVLIFHRRKASAGSALLSIGGSVGIGAAARSVLIVGRNLENDEERVVAVAKASNGPIRPSLTFRIENTEPYGAGRIVWKGRTEITADELAAGRSSEDSSLGNATTFLRDRLLMAGGSMPVQEVLAEADASGISRSTLQRAKKPVGVRSKKDKDAWRWELTKQADRPRWTPDDGPFPGMYVGLAGAKKMNEVDRADREVRSRLRHPN